jgi:type I restriction enzyme S subunit
LGEVVRFQRGHDLPEQERKPGDVPVIGSAGQNGWHNEVIARGPGVSIGRSGASIGKVTYTPIDYWPHNACLYVTDFLGNNPLFMYYFLKTKDFSPLNSGAAQPSLNRNFVHVVSVTIPGSKEQGAIAEILSAYDELIENNRRRIALLEEAAQMLYREWFVRFRFPGHEHVKIIDGIPEGWERRTFHDVCDAIGGGTPKTSKPEYWNDGDIPWYTPTDITRNSCLALLDSTTKITEAGLRGSSAKMLPSGTVLMTSRASVGFFGIIDTPSCTNQGFISIIPRDLCARMYLLHNLMHRVEEIRSHSGGATYKEISKGKFRALPVVVPEALLLREFEEQTATLHAQVLSLHTMNQKLAQARDLLLPRLMNGEIAV